MADYRHPISDVRTNLRMTQEDTPIARQRRRVLYRAEHRGTKEMDWLVGRFAASKVSEMDADTLDQFEKLLALPDPEIESWIRSTSPTEPEGEFGRLIVALRQYHGLA